MKTTKRNEIRDFLKILIKTLRKRKINEILLKFHL